MPLRPKVQFPTVIDCEKLTGAQSEDETGRENELETQRRQQTADHDLEIAIFDAP
jgi:hypothetical protein